MQKAHSFNVFPITNTFFPLFLDVNYTCNRLCLFAALIEMTLFLWKIFKFLRASSHFWFLETGSHIVQTSITLAADDLELLILLSLPMKCWDSRHVKSFLASKTSLHWFLLTYFQFCWYFVLLHHVIKLTHWVLQKLLYYSTLKFPFNII